MKADVRSLLERALEIHRSRGHDGHAVPATRRDFLRIGALTFGAAAIAPWWTREALGGGAPAPTIPSLTWDLAGGAGLPANFLVGKTGGSLDFCSDYRALGWNPRESNALDSAFGLPMSRHRSQILVGLRSQLPAEIFDGEGRCHMQMAGLLHFSLDDQPTNVMSAASLVAASGLHGTKSRVGLGMRDVLSGGYSRALNEDPGTKPKVITSVRDFAALTSLGALDAAPASRRRALLRGLANRALETADRLGVLDEALRQSLGKLEDLGQLNVEGDPRNNEIAARVYGLSDRTSASASDAIEAGIVLNALLRLSGPGIITIGDCDYHDRPEARSAEKDRKIGESIGRALRMAYELRSPLYFQIITDGGVYAEPSDSYLRTWAGDNPEHSMSVVGFYRPGRRVELVRSQIGAYTSAGLVDQSTLIGPSPQNAGLVAFANYLSVNGNLGAFEAISGRRLSNIGYDDAVAFA